MTRPLLGRVCGSFAVFLTAMTLVTGANAAVVVQDLSPVDALDPGDSGSFLQVTFGDQLKDEGEIIEFEVSAPARIDATALTFNFPPFFGIDDFAVFLVKGTGGLGDPFSSTELLATGVPFGGALILSFANLLDEVHYGLLFAGETEGFFNAGLYAGSFSISAVPLPPAVWLFLSALLGLVGVVRRRQIQQLVRARPEPPVFAS